MIFFDVLSAYLGWCPRLNANPIKVTPSPFSYLSTIGKAVTILFLASWGLSNLGNYRGIFTYLETKDMLVLPQFTVLFVNNLIRLASGIIILVLLTDFIISRRVLRRHRLELSTLLISQALFWFVAPLYDVAKLLSGLGGRSVELLPFTLLQSMFEAVLFAYLAYRLLSNKIFFGKNMFLLMSLVFSSLFVITINPAYLSWSQDLLGWLVIGLIEMVYVVAAAFCFGVYLKLRRSGGYELALPLVTRVMIFIYGFVYSGLFTFLLTNNSQFLTGDIVSSLGFFFYLGLIAVSFLPLRFRVGENSIAQELVI
jgi:hypothetical protein